MSNIMTLVKIGAVGGIATVTMGLLYRNKIEQNIKGTVYYKEALRTVRTNRGAVHLLGEPIKDGKIDLDDTETNFTSENSAHYEVPIRGPKQKGRVYFWASKHDNNWVVYRVELGLENEPDRRLLIKNQDQ
nr:PREDICTED: uncharacterized protein LOC663757 [Tribolium castaneum]|eukprot:XP_974885.1 PREDICTED: uncharacterized protein LOC663757 [Tribolium castaneum]